MVRVTPSRLALLTLAVVSAAAWVYGVIELQPLSEPGPDGYAENNTYWLRELRWGALLALVLAAIAQAGGTRQALRAMTVAGALWLTTDVALDRYDHLPHATTLAITAVLFYCTVASTGPIANLGPTTDAGPSASATANINPSANATAKAGAGGWRPGVLRAVAVVAAVASGLVAGVESPTDTEPELTSGAATVAFLLALVAVATAVHAAGSFRQRMLAPALLVAAVPWLIRFASPQPTTGRAFATFAYLVVLVVIVVALSRPHTRQRLRDHAAAAAITAVMVPLVLLPLTLLSIVWQTGKPFTAFAGNPPINTADEDILLVILAVPVGLVLHKALQGLLPDKRPLPADVRSGAPSPG
ncbi:hypothetical protein OWR29_01485 [Actinoplanes sp. Pm04-4]|uniref:Uncharacterized protein n=1 Tax=Paractinoplanes pyxinae TaxID=2997416 RepID=A0ABT4AQY1_9ACTN|nr:hypothetical protein [Actinoplanes pyxinae]MCY1136653.1 hypothetical protein [Actinoplanes pyxinae]